MAPRKGLSVDDKRRGLMEIFYETKDFWSLKELEKMGPKQKGIVSQSVKEILDFLVSDNLVHLEKIGTSNYYWSFPSQGVKTRKRLIGDLSTELDVLITKKAQFEEGILKAQEGREESDGRLELLAELKELGIANKQLGAELQMFKDCDPAILEAKGYIIAKAAKEARAHADRWADNILILQSYAKTHFNSEPAMFLQSFGIPEDFDSA